VLIEPKSELCNRGNNTSYIYIYLGVRLTRERESVCGDLYYLYTPTLSGKSVCGDLLTCIPLFMESVFEVPLKKQKKEEIKKKKTEKKKRKARV
jgi:hypothetical protein